MSREIGGMNSKLPELARRYGELLEQKQEAQRVATDQARKLDEINSQLAALGIEMNELAGKSCGGPNIIELTPGRALIVEYGKGISEANFAPLVSGSNGIL